MYTIKYYFLFFINTVLINNCVFMQFLGLCPFLGVSKKIEVAIYMGLSTTFVITLSSIITWIINYFIIIPCEITYLRTLIYISVIATTVQVTEIIIKNISPIFYRLLGIFLPLITTNCIVLGIPLISINYEYNFLQSTFYGFSSAIGFLLAIVFFSAIRERIELSNVPSPFKGSSIGLITAGIMSLSFMGFTGIIKP